MGRNNATEIVGYCDADWAGDKSDRKSTTGYCTFVGGNLVTWRSKKQKVVSRSSAEAEYRAMANTTGELVWIKAFLKDLGIESSEPITLHCDNQAAIHIASNSVFHERTKHIEVDCHYVREKVEAGVILPTFVRSVDQLADVFTKATTSKVCEDLHSKMGLLDLHQPILRGSVEMKIKSQDQGEESSLANDVVLRGRSKMKIQSEEKIQSEDQDLANTNIGPEYRPILVSSISCSEDQDLANTNIGPQYRPILVSSISTREEKTCQPLCA